MEESAESKLLYNPYTYLYTLFLKTKGEKQMAENIYEEKMIIANDIRATIEKLNILLDAATRENMEVNINIYRRNSEEMIGVIDKSEALVLKPITIVKKEI